MASGEKDYDVDAQSKFLNRRDELREHAAKGRGLGVDETLVPDLRRAADSLRHTVDEHDSGKDLAKIEKGELYFPRFTALRMRVSRSMAPLDRGLSASCLSLDFPDS